MAMAIRRPGFLTFGEWPWPFADPWFSQLVNGRGHSPFRKSLESGHSLRIWPFVLFGHSLVRSQYDPFHIVLEVSNCEILYKNLEKLSALLANSKNGTK